MDPNWLPRASSAARSSGSAWPSSSSSAGCSSRSCPGDTLLFALGLFIAGGKYQVLRHRQQGRSSWPSRSSLLTVAAFLGNVVGYEIGRRIGPPLYERDGRILKRKHFDKTSAFFEKHGNKALVIGRFVPFVRTYITVVAGRHPDGAAPLLPLERRRRGAAGCSASCCSATSSARRFPALGENIDYAVLAILAFSVIPIASSGASTAATAAAAGEAGRAAADRPRAELDRPSSASARPGRRPARPW